MIRHCITNYTVTTQIPSPDLDPYETFSPESRDSVQLASEAILKSQEIRRELRAAVDNKKLLQVSAHNTVNEGLTRKLAETITITVNFVTDSVQLRNALKGMWPKFTKTET